MSSALMLAPLCHCSLSVSSQTQPETGLCTTGTLVDPLGQFSQPHSHKKLIPTLEA